MLDHFSIFTKGGMVLWSYTQAKLKGSPVDNLIRKVLLEERGGESSFNIDTYALKWTFANEFDLIFVVVYQKIIHLLYIDELLELVKKKFCDHFRGVLENPESRTRAQFEFTDMFCKILDTLENRSQKQKINKAEKGPRQFNETRKTKSSLKDSGSQVAAGSPVKAQPDNSVDSADDAPTGSNQDSGDVEDKIKQNIEKLKQKVRKPGPMKKTIKPALTASGNTPPKKGVRKWDDTVSKEEKAALDYSAKFGADQQERQEERFEASQMDVERWNSDESEPEEDSEEEVEAAEVKQSGFMSFFKTLTGNKPLDAADLEPLLFQFKQHLISKNVASEIAEKLCESVSASLQGKKAGSFMGLKSTVRTALEEALVRILTPKKNIDILRDAMDAKQQRLPYVIVFVGVNGVGKSTNLAKVCCWLQQNGLSVMFAACDTFRSGAVEQLNVHAKRLGVELFERGYRSEPTAIAMDAVRAAKQKGLDVVLIDTAGRMQDNEPLMKALSKLVNTVRPNLVLFVGEALVGNDAVDQLTKYNQALMDLSKDREPRLIDGIILTKFDTIDDKVGAAISMVYTTGQPIVFLGTGQHYTDLKKLNVQVVTKALLKGS